MAGGRLQCVGSPEELRSTYGTGLALQLVAPRDVVPQVQAQVVARFPSARLHEEHHGHMRYYLGEGDRQRLSQVYAALEAIRAQFEGLSYHVAETSLEDVFLRFATRHKTDAQRSQDAAAAGEKARRSTARRFRLPRLALGRRKSYDLLAGDPEGEDSDDEGMLS